MLKRWIVAEFNGLAEQEGIPAYHVFALALGRYSYLLRRLLRWVPFRFTLSEDGAAGSWACQKEGKQNGPVAVGHSWTDGE